MMSKFRMIILLSLVGLIVVGCNKKGINSDNKNAGNNTIKAEAAVKKLKKNLTDKDMFTTRDYENNYDASNCATIKLSGITAKCDKNAVSINKENITIKEEGVYVVTGELKSGMIVVDASKNDKIQIVLKNANITSNTSAAIYVKQANKVFITLDKNSKNILANGGKFTNIDENNIDGVIFSKDDLTINGEGDVSISTKAGHGIVSKDDLVVTNGNININASSHGLVGKQSVRVGGGNITLEVGKDGIHAENIDNVDEGYVYISKGNIKVIATDDGIHANNSLIIKDGDINITKSYEGLEGNSIDIYGGHIALVASDDGLNAAGGNDNSGVNGPKGHGNDIFATSEESFINIEGGKLVIDASGDGIDSNGYLLVTGGETYVSGPINGGNGALDYGLDAQINGGTFIATGTSGMATNFTSNSKQGAILTTINGNKEDKLQLLNSKKEIIIEWDITKNFQSVVVSCSSVKKGNSYTLICGKNSLDIKMDDIIFGEGKGNLGNPDNQRGGGPGKKDDSSGGMRKPDMPGESNGGMHRPDMSGEPNRDLHKPNMSGEPHEGMERPDRPNEDFKQMEPPNSADNFDGETINEKQETQEFI